MTDHAQLLKQTNLRVTPARIAVLELLETAEHPVDVAFIVDQVNQGNQSYDQATVYRAVEVLVKQRLVKQVDFREGKYRYELEGDHHHHLVCKKCGSVTPVYDECLALTDTDISKKYNFTVSEHHLEFFGFCQKCQ